MARPKTSVNRLDNLKNEFVANVGKVLTCKQVEATVGASYWRACVKDLKDGGMNIEAVRDGRNVVGYKYVEGASAAADAGEMRKAAAKPKVVAKKKAVKKPAVKKKTEKKEASAKTSVKKSVKKAVKEVKPAKEAKVPAKVSVKKPKKASVKKEVDVANVIEEMETNDYADFSNNDPELQAILKAAGLPTD